MFSVTFYIFAVCLNHIVIEAHKSIGQKKRFLPYLHATFQNICTAISSMLISLPCR